MYKNNMVLMPEGTFYMGASESGWGETEYPLHEVFIKSFYLDETLTTNYEFELFVDETNYKTTAELKGGGFGYTNGIYQYIDNLSWKSYNTPDRKEHPVILVSWEDANNYSNWCNKRLPTEAEWEYAAKVGNSNKLYPWGNESAINKCNMAKVVINIPCTTPVKAFESNGFGLYDMAGNVWDLCSDSFESEFYHNSPIKNPICINSSDLICRRGGAFNIVQEFRCRNSNRGAFPKKGYAINVGFRCAKNI
jgi:formylglycine-generating enzyme